MVKKQKQLISIIVVTAIVVCALALGTLFIVRYMSVGTMVSNANDASITKGLFTRNNLVRRSSEVPNITGDTLLEGTFKLEADQIRNMLGQPQIINCNNKEGCELTNSTGIAEERCETAVIASNQERIDVCIDPVNNEVTWNFSWY